METNMSNMRGNVVFYQRIQIPALNTTGLARPQHLTVTSTVQYKKHAPAFR